MLSTVGVLVFNIVKVMRDLSMPNSTKVTFDLLWIMLLLAPHLHHAILTRRSDALAIWGPCHC